MTLNNKNILVLSYEYPPIGGGGGKVVQGLAKEFTQLGYHIDIVTMNFRGLVKNEKLKGINIYRVPCIRGKESVCHSYEMASYILSAIPVVKRLIDKRQYIVNHTHFIFPDGIISYFLKKIAGLPYVITSHGSDVQGYNPDRFKIQHKIFSPIWNTIVENAELIVCPSHTLKSLILHNKPDTKAKVIPNGIAVGRFDPNRKKQKRILVVTRMLKRKGVQYVLKALKGYKHDFEVNIVGEGPYLDTLRQNASLDNIDVKFLGWLDNESAELKELFETSSIFIFPSEAENFPIVLLEAMVAGMAIITTEGTGCSEVVGDSGILVKPHNHKEIRTALDTLIRSPGLSRELGISSRKRVEENFGWTSVANRYLALFQKYIRS